MANLRQTLRGAGGGLFETSAEQAKQLGVTSPMMLANQGQQINPDQAKMAGTPAQKGSALRAAVRGEQDLATAKRRQGVRGEASEQELGKMARAKRLEAAGNLGGRVQEKIDAQLQAAFANQQATADAGQITVVADPETGVVLTDDQVKLVQKIINSTDPQLQANDLVALNQALGRTKLQADASSPPDGSDVMLNADEVADFFGGQVAASGAAAQAQFDSVDSAIEQGLLNFKDFGYDNQEQLESDLGLEAGALGTMTVEKLVSTIDQAIEKEYKQVENLQARASDPSLSPALRAEAKAQLREMGAVGVRSAESSMDQLAEDIEDAATIQVGGEETTVQELLDSEFMSALAANYFEGTDAQRETIKNDPALKDFVKYIEQHKDVFADAVQEVTDDVKEFWQNQQNNSKIAEVAGVTIDDEVMAKLLPEWNQISTQDWWDENEGKPSASVPAIITELHGSESPELVVGKFKQVTDNYPNMVSEFKNLTSEQLYDLGMTNLDPNNKDWDTNLYHLETKGKVDSLNSTNPDPDAISSLLGLENADGLKNMINEARTKKNSGWFGESDKFEKLLDIIPSENPDTWSTEDWADFTQKLKNNYLGAGKQGSLTFDQLLNNPPRHLNQEFSGAKDFSSQQDDSGVYDLVKQAFVNKPEFTQQDYDTIVGPISDAAHGGQLDLLYQNSKLQDKAAGIDLKGQIFKKARHLNWPKVEEFAKGSGFRDTFDVVTQLQGLAPDKENFAKFDNLIAQADAQANAFPEGSLQRDLWLDYKQDIEPRLADYKKRSQDKWTADADKEMKKLRDKLRARKKSGQIGGELGKIGESVKKLVNEGRIGGTIGETTEKIKSQAKNLTRPSKWRL